MQRFGIQFSFYLKSDFIYAYMTLNAVLNLSESVFSSVKWDDLYLLSIIAYIVQCLEYSTSVNGISGRTSKWSLKLLIFI